MAGIYCVAVSALPGVAGKLERQRCRFDSSLSPGLLLAPDMGGWASAAARASTSALAAYAGLLVASTLGCLVSFVLPASLGALQYHQAMGFMQGVVWGVVALPAGLVAGGAVILKIAPGVLLQNLWPVWPSVPSSALRFALHRSAAPECCLVWAGVRWLGACCFAG